MVYRTPQEIVIRAAEIPIVVEDIDADGSDAGVSFQGSNPTPDFYFKCRSRSDAFRLLQLITSIRPNRAE